MHTGRLLALALAIGSLGIGFLLAIASVDGGPVPSGIDRIELPPPSTGSGARVDPLEAAELGRLLAALRDLERSGSHPPTKGRNGRAVAATAVSRAILDVHGFDLPEFRRIHAKTLDAMRHLQGKKPGARTKEKRVCDETLSVVQQNWAEVTRRLAP